MVVRGTEGYGEAAADLVDQYESISFKHAHRDTIHLIPQAPSRVLDIGAGSGRDAAALAACGHDVVAIEPTRELRELARTLHPHPKIRWMDDGLPDLARVLPLGEQFDLILLSAVWMHLNEAERSAAMGGLARLLAQDGVIIMSIRHGPVPPGRRMFDVPEDEMAMLAVKNGLAIVHTSRRADVLGRNDVRWTVLGLSHAKPSTLV